MADILEESLSALQWPRETLVSFEVDADRTVWLDVDLPEIEDLPSEVATVAKRGMKINVKEKSDAQRRKEYMTHIHGIGFRLVGEVLYRLPAARRVVVSGYSEWPVPATGQLEDQYLFSATVDADDWASLAFNNLPAVDLVLCFEQFDLRRKVTKTGIFTPIQPFEPAETTF